MNKDDELPSQWKVPNWIAFGGAFLPATDSKFYKILFKICFTYQFVIGIIFTADAVMSLISAAMAGHLIRTLFLCLHVIGAIYKYSILYTLLFHQEDIRNIFNFPAGWNVVRFQERRRKKLLKEKMAKVKRLMLFMTSLSAGLSLAMQWYTMLKYGRVAVPSFYLSNPSPSQLTIITFTIYSNLAGINYVLVATTGYYVFLSIVSLMRIEFELCGLQLEYIFSILNHDQEKDSIHGNELSLLEPNKAYNAKAKIKYADRSLNDVIQWHAQLKKVGKILNKMFSPCITLHASYSVMLMIALIFVTKSFENIPIGIAVHAMINMAYFGFNAFYSDDLTASDELVVSEVYKKGWYLYPVSMQKKLWVIMTNCLTKPMELNYRKVYAINREAFFEVGELSYSLVTFLNGVV